MAPNAIDVYALHASFYRQNFEFDFFLCFIWQHNHKLLLFSKLKLNTFNIDFSISEMSLWVDFELKKERYWRLPRTFIHLFVKKKNLISKCEKKKFAPNPCCYWQWNGRSKKWIAVKYFPVQKNRLISFHRTTITLSILSWRRPYNPLNWSDDWYIHLSCLRQFVAFNILL